MPVLLATLLAPAHACSACEAGDPTINLMGTERPRRGQVRFAADLKYRYERADVPYGGTWRADEGILGLGVSWAPHARWVVAANLPVGTAGVQTPDLSTARGWGLGDAELRVRFVAARDDADAPRHLGGLTAGAELPTAIRLKDEHGRFVGDDAQLGTGAFSPSLGLWYGWNAVQWSVFTSLSGRVSTRGWDGVVPGPTALGTVAVQWQPHLRVAARLAVDARWSAKERQYGEVEEASGGWLLAVSPTLVVTPTVDWALYASVGVPFAQQQGGGVREGVSPNLGVIVDL